MEENIVVRPRVVVKAPSWIQLGIMDLKGDLGRIYGSVGITIKDPQTVVEVSISDVFRVEGENKSKAEKFAKSFSKEINLDCNFEVKVIKAAPRHVGLGSDTELALAIGSAISRLFRSKLFNLHLSTEEISRLMGRGRFSGIGTYAFKFGGFIIDGGCKVGQSEIPPLILRYNFPKEWFFVIGIPNIKRLMEEEDEEIAMIKVMKSVKEGYAGEASRIVLMKLLPALIQNDLREFGEAVSLLGAEVGEILSAVPGGTFNDSIVKEGIDFLLKNGACGAGQSLWGPAFYGIVKGEKEARKLAASSAKFLGERDGGQVIYTNANNDGGFVRYYIVKTS